MALLADVHLRGSRATQPAASSANEGVIYCVTDESNILERSDGSSWQAYSPSSGGGGGGDATQNSFLVSGGHVVWQSAYIFLVSAATYYIGGTLYTSAQQSITLDAADPTNDRIDVIALDNTGTVVKVTGTAAAQPSEPDIDPGTQLKLSFVLVGAATTEPPAIATEIVYADNAGSPTEWNWSTSGSGFNVNSTNNPRSPSTKCIEGTTVASGAYAQGQIGSGTLTPSDYGLLVLYVRSKATWANNRGLSVSLRSAGVLVGSSVTIDRVGTWGFNSANTTDYQQIAIPISTFGVPAASTITQVRVTDFGGSIGFYLDDISFQAGGSTQTPSGITQAEADALYLKQASNLSDLGSVTTARSNLGVAPNTPSYLVLATNSELTSERVLTAGTGVSFVDGGAGGTLTVSATGTGGDVVGPGSATDNALARFDLATGKLIQNSAVTLSDTGALTLPDDVRQTFNPGATVAGINVGAHAGSPSTLTDGDLWYDSTANALKARINGGTISLASGLTTGVLGITIDGGGSAITTGVKGDLYCAFACTITAATLLADQSGSVVIDIWKDTYANYPPTVADTITASAKPTLSSAVKSQDVTLTGWTTSVSAGDTIRFNVDSASTLTRVQLTLTVTR